MTLRAGMIGTYDHVGVFANDAVRRDDIEFVGAYEPDPERAKGLVEKYGVRIFGSKQALLDADLDIVGLFSPFYEKADDTVVCLGRGLHVLSDKPAAINPQGLAGITDAVERHPELILTMALTQRFGPAFNRIDSLIQEGAIGRLISMSCRNSYRLRRPTRPEFMFDDRLSGGEWAELSVHGLHTMSWIAGAHYVSVSAFHGCASSPDEPYQDHGEGLFAFDNGVTAFVAHDRTVPDTGPGSNTVYNFYGSEGRIDFNNRTDGPMLWNNAGERSTIEVTGGWLPLFGNFVDAVVDGAPLTVSTREVLRTTAAALAAYESAENGGKRVSI